MGSYSHIAFAGYPIYELKNSYHDEILNLIFQPEDYTVERRIKSSRNKIVWGDAYANDYDKYNFKGYKQTVGVCRKRLEIYGNSFKKSKKDFSLAKKFAQKEEFYDFSLKGFTYENYLSEIKSIISSQTKRYDPNYSNIKESLNDDLSIYGQSLACHLYSILSILPDNELVEYDLTEVIESGWVDENNVKNINYEKIIVLTEGKTDVEFISRSIEMFYPYLFKYYHFIDFEEYKIESNASALVKLIISFAAANVKHPIIALFDNDTTGQMEMKNLTLRNLPDNYRIVKYPNIALAKKYPTIGATGKKRMNINGLACGIEMYLGVESLTNDNEFIPIHWKSYNEKEKKYQGEILNKKSVQEKFRTILQKCQICEMPEMNQLLNEIFEAFK